MWLLSFVIFVHNAWLTAISISWHLTRCTSWRSVNSQFCFTPELGQLGESMEHKFAIGSARDVISYSKTLKSAVTVHSPCRLSQKQRRLWRHFLTGPEARYVGLRFLFMGLFQTKSVSNTFGKLTQPHTKIFWKNKYHITCYVRVMERVRTEFISPSVLKDGVRS